MCMLNTLISVILIVLGIKLFTVYQEKKKELVNTRELNLALLNADEEIKKTLLIGLYHRFNADVGQLEGEDSNPYEFESFVAQVMEIYYGGNAFVTQRSGDYGVDIEHNRVDGRYLGQVKCYSDSIKYEPIALIHSNMVKEDAKGGFVVTTSQFTEPAKKYNEVLNIELIDGMKLVEYWLEGLQKQIGKSVDENKEVETA